MLYAMRCIRKTIFHEKWLWNRNWTWWDKKFYPALIRVPVPMICTVSINMYACKISTQETKWVFTAGEVKKMKFYLSIEIEIIFSLSFNIYRNEKLTSFLFPWKNKWYFILIIYHLHHHFHHKVTHMIIISLIINHHHYW